MPAFEAICDPLQENVTLKINVAKTHRYMLAVKYILAGTKQSFATFHIRNLQRKGKVA